MSQYLREQRTLSLPGLGVFSLSAPLPPSTDNPEIISSYIQFENKKIKEADDGLISYIKEHTGKIKPLAIADLDTFLESGKEMLNIGKPFYIEGIGSIIKKKDGEYEFTAKEITSSKVEQYHQSDHDKKMSVFEESKYEPRSNPWQKIIVVLLAIAGIAVVVLGGYYLYNKNNNADSGNTSSPATDSTNQQQNLIDSSRIQQDSSSAVVQTPVSNGTSGSYRFVIKNTTNKRAALARYNQLKGLAIQMDAKDSVNYKVFFLINANARDTAYIKDSLSRWYATRVVIERNN